MTTRTLTELLRLASMQPDQEQRKIAALVGACVADAAARPLHWVYDMEALEKYLNETFDDQVDRTKQPEFYPENKSPFYSLPTGENSCYFDITLTSLESLVKYILPYLRSNKICIGYFSNSKSISDYNK